MLSGTSTPGDFLRMRDGEQLNTGSGPPCRDRSYPPLSVSVAEGVRGERELPLSGAGLPPHALAGEGGRPLFR